MINMFHTWHVSAILFFMPCPEPPMGISQCGIIPSAVWRFSNIFSSSLGVGILALNRGFSHFLVAGMFYTWGCLDTPTFIHPHTFVCPLYISMPLCPILFCASVCFWGLCMLWGVVMGSPLCWDTLPYIIPVGGASP